MNWSCEFELRRPYRLYARGGSKCIETSLSMEFVAHSTAASVVRCAAVKVLSSLTSFLEKSFTCFSLLVYPTS